MDTSQVRDPSQIHRPSFMVVYVRSAAGGQSVAGRVPPHPPNHGLATLIEKEVGQKVELIEGAGGIFDIHADGKPVYLKSETGEFPQDGEVVKALKSLKK